MCLDQRGDLIGGSKCVWIREVTSFRGSSVRLSMYVAGTGVTVLIREVP